MITKKRIIRIKQNLEVKNEFFVLECIRNLEKENEELKEYVEKLSEQHADEWQKQQEVITELKAQIEKMKCCGNCKYKEDCVYENAWDLCNKWELVE